jgi:Uncharacterised MFS-type transporter YbfB
MRVKRVTVEAGFSEGEPYGAWAIAASGMVSLALAMGLGRFIYAPLLPAMLLEGSLTLSQGGTLAMMNYVGYFIGALLAFWMRPDPARMVRISLILTIVLVPGMALHGSVLLWMALRLFSGIYCAFAMVYTTAWSQQRLLDLGRPELSSVIFCGPGVGVVITSVPSIGMVALHWPASWECLVFTLLGVVMLPPILRVMRSSSHLPLQAVVVGPTSTSAPRLHARTGLNFEAYALTLIYGWLRLHHHSHVPADHRPSCDPGQHLGRPVFSDVWSRRGDRRIHCGWRRYASRQPMHPCVSLRDSGLGRSDQCGLAECGRTVSIRRSHLVFYSLA